MTPVWD